jgi:cation diffusion facilitator family transporter
MKPLAQWSKKRIGYLGGFVSIALNSALFGVKLWAGLATDSVSMQADAWHTLSDSLTSLIVIIGFWIASRPADREHPFGHGRAELAASLVIGTLLIVVGVTFGWDSIERLRNRQTASFTLVAVVVFGVSALCKEAMAQFSLRLGKRINSTALKADAWHHRSDAIASALIVAGALLGPYLWWIDGALGLAVSALIVYSAAAIIWENTKAIMGEPLPTAARDDIVALVASLSGDVSDIHHFHFHKYGDHAELTFHVRVKKTMDVGRAHALTAKIEAALKKKYDFDATIHIEPEQPEPSGA